MANEIAKCVSGHEIDGVMPYVDELKFEVQHPELIGRVCDCRKFTYFEQKCQTCSGDKWRISWKENMGG
jgi:hypothetical protein